MAGINERLWKAARNGSNHKLKALMNEPGCDVLATDKDGMTALMWAALIGHSAALGLLLCKSDTLVQDKGGMTALMCAAWGGDGACVRLLLPVSDVLAMDQVGKTAATYARDDGYESLAQSIDAYAWAQSERAAIGAEVDSTAPRGRAVRRV